MLKHIRGSMGCYSAVACYCSAWGVPETNIQWLSTLREAARKAGEHGIPTPEYHWPWVVRLHLIVEMRVLGIQKLIPKRDWGIDALNEACQPYMNKWIVIWMKGLAANSTKKLLRRLAYQEPLEMLGCFGCLLGDTIIQAIPFEILKARQDDIKQARRDMFEQHGRRECNPALVVKAAMDQVVKEEVHVTVG